LPRAPHHEAVLAYCMRLSLVMSLSTCCFLGSVGYWSQQTLHGLQDTYPAAKNIDTVPSTFSLRVLSLGQWHTLADMLYLQAVALYGQRSTHPETYQLLAPMLARATDLDPYFAAAYLLAGTALTMPGMENSVGISLLAQGSERLPENFTVQFLYGFAAYDVAHDNVTAAKAFGRAALLPGSPSFLRPLAARVSAQAHDPAIGIALLDTLLAQTTDAEQRRAYERRRDYLVLEQMLVTLQASVDAYRARYGHIPTDFAALVTSGVLQALPIDPTGGAFGLTVAGEVTTTHEHLRLIRQPEAS
jgi:hypothetical protein